MAKKGESTRSYASVPLGISKISSFFGKISPESIEFEIPYVKIKGQIDETSLSLVVPKEAIEQDRISEQILLGISKMLSDPIQHKMFFAPFAFANHQYGHYWFDVSDFCDFFGYQRDASGRHDTDNRKKIMKLHGNLRRIGVEIPAIRGNKKIVYEGKFVYIVDAEATGYIDGVEVFKKGKFGILTELWNDVKKYGYYAPLDKRAFRINSKEYPWGFKIYSAIVFEARRSWNKGVRDKGALISNLLRFLDTAGIDVSTYIRHRNFSLLMDRLIKELEYLKRCHRTTKNNLSGSVGLIDDYEIREENLRVWLTDDLKIKLGAIKDKSLSKAESEEIYSLTSDSIVAEHVRHHIDQSILEGFYKELSYVRTKSRIEFIAQLATAALKYLLNEKREILIAYGAPCLDPKEIAQRIAQNFPYNRGWGKSFIIQQVDSMIYMEILGTLRELKSGNLTETCG
jgi:hypothetical protein